MSTKKRVYGRKEVDLDEMVKSGAQGAYEALQLYRSKANRCKTKNDILEAIKVAANGSRCLLENGYDSAGAELSGFLLDLLSESDYNINNPEIREYLNNIDEKLPKASNLRADFLKGCVKWSIASGNREFGDPAMQAKLAECLWAKNDKSAAFHFAAGESPGELSSLIFLAYSLPDQQDLRDKALTIGIVNFLALENLRDANNLMYQYLATLQKHNFSRDGELIQFCLHLLETCRRDAQPLFKQLVNVYASKLDFDESVPQLLMGPIAYRFFGIKPKVNPMMSMLQSMLA